MTTITAERNYAERWSRLDPRHLQHPAALVFNPNAGHKLGVETNSSGPDEVQAALKSEGNPLRCLANGTCRARD
jgi:hypothetical protein